jgi:general stress protein CsbA
MPDGLFTWQTLGTLAGAAAITYLVVAYTKGLVDLIPWFKFIGTDLYAVLVGAIVLIAASAALGQALTWAVILLAVFNGFLVAATAGKMSDKALTEANKKQGTDAGM